MVNEKMVKTRKNMGLYALPPVPEKSVQAEMEAHSKFFRAIHVVALIFMAVFLIELILDI
jgi:hypothetical protein